MKKLLQITQNPEQGTGKYYVVAGVLAILFVGIVIYLFSLDKRLKKLENETNHEK